MKTQAFYEDLVHRHGWEHLHPFLEILPSLINASDQFGLTSFTSHENLIFSKHEGYPEWFEDDRVLLRPLFDESIQIEYRPLRADCSSVVEILSYTNLASRAEVYLKALAETKQTEQGAASDR